MSFYTELLDQDRINEGMDAPRPSLVQTLLGLYSLMDMSPEARLAKSERIEAAFAKTEAELRRKATGHDEDEIQKLAMEW